MSVYEGSVSEGQQGSSPQLYPAGAGGRESFLEEVTIQPEGHWTVCLGLYGEVTGGWIVAWRGVGVSSQVRKVYHLQVRD